MPPHVPASRAAVGRRGPGASRTPHGPRRHERPPVPHGRGRRRRPHSRHRGGRSVRVRAHRAGTQSGRCARRREGRPEGPGRAAGPSQPVVPAVGQPARHHRHHTGHRLSRRACDRKSVRAEPRRARHGRNRGWRHRDRARVDPGHGAVDGVRRARAQEPRDRRPAAHGARRRVAAERVREHVPLADRCAQRARPTPIVRRLGMEPAEELRSARSPQRAELVGAGQRRAAARSTRAPRRCSTGRCASPTAPPKNS